MADDRTSRNSRPSSDEERNERRRRETWENEGGSVDRSVSRQNPGRQRVASGRVVRTGRAGEPYKVVLTREDGRKSEHLFPTMREGEAFIRRMAPTPPKRDTSRDRDPGRG